MLTSLAVKHRTEQHAKQPGKFQTVIPINAAWYLENFLAKEVAPVFGGFPHFPDEEGYLTFRVPNWGGDNQVPFLSITDDYGDIVQGIFLDPVRWNGHVVHGASQILSFDQLVANFEEGESNLYAQRCPQQKTHTDNGSHWQKVSVPTNPSFLGSL